MAGLIGDASDGDSSGVFEPVIFTSRIFLDGVEYSKQSSVHPLSAEDREVASFFPEVAKGGVASVEVSGEDGDAHLSGSTVPSSSVLSPSDDESTGSFTPLIEQKTASALYGGDLKLSPSPNAGSQTATPVEIGACFVEMSQSAEKQKRGQKRGLEALQAPPSHTTTTCTGMTLCDKASQFHQGEEVEEEPPQKRKKIAWGRTDLEEAGTLL